MPSIHDNLVDAGPYIGVVTSKAGVTTTPVLAANITYGLRVNVEGGYLDFTNVTPVNERPPPPRITLGAPIGSGCLVQFIAGVLCAFIVEWPATKVCP